VPGTPPGYALNTGGAGVAPGVGIAIRVGFGQY
jgi:hypothetical protein